MVKFPLIVIYAVVAFNITAFAVLLQLDVLIFHSTLAKVATWALAVTAWALAYANRNRFFTFRYDDRKDRARR